MKLYVDIGNSRIKLVPDENGFSDPVSLVYKQEALADALAPWLTGLKTPERIVVANVAGARIAAEFSGLCRQTWGLEPCYLAPERECLGLQNGYNTPAQLGVDRWLAMLAAWHIYGGPVCIVDCGTALTVDLVATEGEHLGGYILPGMELMVQCLGKRTAGIRPEPGADMNTSPGRTTGEGLGHAALRSAKVFIEDVYREYGAESGVQMKCILTGGDARMVSQVLAIPFIIEPLLVFQGIRLVDGVAL